VKGAIQSSGCLNFLSGKAHLSLPIAAYASCKPMTIQNEADVTAAVLAKMDHASDPR
jgi:hypothetical protein